MTKRKPCYAHSVPEAVWSGILFHFLLESSSRSELRKHRGSSVLSVKDEPWEVNIIILVQSSSFALPYGYENTF